MHSDEMMEHGTLQKGSSITPDTVGPSSLFEKGWCGMKKIGISDAFNSLEMKRSLHEMNLDISGIISSFLWRASCYGA